MSRHKLDVKLHYRASFGSYCEMHVDPETVINFYYGSKDKMGDMFGTNRESTGGL